MKTGEGFRHWTAERPPLSASASPAFCSAGKGEKEASHLKRECLIILTKPPGKFRIMPTSQDRILTTHVGSLVRPAELSRYIEAIDNGVKVDQAAFDRCLSASVAEVVKRQQQAGVDIVSDGEFGKFRSWSFYVLDRLGGIEEREIAAARGAGRDQLMFPDFYAEYFPTQKLPKRGTVVCVGPVIIKAMPRVKRISRFSRPASKVRRSPTPSCRWWRRRARCRVIRTNTTRTTKNFCSSSPRRCAKNTKRLSRPG